MKKVLLVIFALISLNVFSQINVKEGSFRKIDGYVMLDKNKHLDDNDNPMALIKVTTENISAEERAKFTYKGNIETYFDVHQHKDGQTYLYISAEAATFIEIIHPDYGKTEYTFPFDLCDYCGYEMVVQYVPLVPVVTQESSKPKKTYLIVKSDQTDARIYIDDDLVNTHEASKAVDVGSTHTYKIECNLYHTESGSVTVNDRTEINKKLRPAFGYINISTSPEQGAKAFVDGDYVGLTPITTDKIRSGSHTVMVMKDMYKMKEQSYNVTDGQTINATLNMDANFVTITLTVDIDADIYVDEEFKGKGKWSGRLSDGAHIFEARKENHKTSVKAVNLVLGKNESIALDAPTPINGDIDINTTPMGATIYIDGKKYGETPNYISDILIGEHELKLTKQGCSELKKTIAVEEGETLMINEKLQTGKETTITADKPKMLKSYWHKLQKEWRNKMCDCMSVQLCWAYLGAHKNWLIESAWGITLDGIYKLDDINGELGWFVNGMGGKKRSFSLTSGLTVGFMDWSLDGYHCLRLGIGYGRRGYEYSEFDITSMESKDLYGVIDGVEFLIGYFVFSENVLSGSVDIVFSPNMIEFRVGFGFPWRMK